MLHSVAGPCSVCGCSERSCSTCTLPLRCSSCTDCCCSGEHKTWRRTRLGAGLRLEYASLGWMSVEAVASIGVGVLASSLALVAFGSDSIVELLSSVVVSRHIKDDAGGRGEVGERASMFSSILLLSIVPILGAGAGYSFLSGIRPEGSLLGVSVAAASALIMPYLWLQKKRIGKETRCLPLQIDAIESATCFFMSLALLAGLLAEFLYGLWWADYLAAAVILAFVAKEGAESYRESMTERSGRSRARGGGPRSAL